MAGGFNWGVGITARVFCVALIPLACTSTHEPGRAGGERVGTVSQAVSQPTLNPVEQIWVGSHSAPSQVPASYPPSPFAFSPAPVRGVRAGRDGLSAYTGPRDETILWSDDLAGPVRSTAALATDGTIYVGSHAGFLAALQPDGGEKWRVEVGAPVDSSPAIAFDGTIYVGSAAGKLYAIGPSGGTNWVFAPQPPHGEPLGCEKPNATCAPDEQQNFAVAPVMGVDGSIYVVSYGGELYAVHPDGNEAWRFHAPGPGAFPVALGFSSDIYLGAGTALYAIRSDGTQRWRFRVPGGVSSAPCVAYDGTIYVGSTLGRLYAIAPTGQERWVFRSHGRRVLRSGAHGGAPAAPATRISSAPAVTRKGTVYFGTADGRLYAVAPTGSKLWQCDATGAVTGSPALGANGTVYFGTDSGRIYAVGRSGDIVWKRSLGGAVRASPTVTQDDGLIVASDDHNLYTFGHPPVSAAQCKAAVGSSCACVCAACLPEYQQCEADPGCLAIRACSLAKSCAGSRCYRPSVCQSTIDASGGLFSASARRFLALARCAEPVCPGC